MLVLAWSHSVDPITVVADRDSSSPSFTSCSRFHSNMSPTEQELFFYNGDSVTTENLAHYKPCGLHPIILGDVLPEHGTCADDESRQPRYRVAQKLGHGAFATVWLVRDLEKE